MLIVTGIRHFIFNLVVGNLFATAKRANDFLDILPGVIEIAFAILAMIPVAIKINLATLDDNLPALGKRHGHLLPYRCVYAGERWARNAHDNRSLVMIVKIVITQAQCFILFKKQLHRFGFSAIRIGTIWFKPLYWRGIKHFANFPYSVT